MLQLKITTPEKEVFNETVSQVNVPTTQGELGILPHHADLMAKLIPGELVIKSGNKTENLAIGGGFVQVSKDTVTILTDLAQFAQSIDEKAVEEAKKRAEKAMDEKLSDEEIAETLSIIEKATAQLKVKRRHRAR